MECKAINYFCTRQHGAFTSKKPREGLEWECHVELSRSSVMTECSHWTKKCQCTRMDENSTSTTIEIH